MPDNIPLILTIDLEEFDIPLEYGQSLDLTEQMAVSYEGLKKLLPVLEKHQVAATFFTTAHWATHYPDMVYVLAQTHEIASHAYFHSSFDEKDYAASKKTLENIAQQTIHGFRMPRLRPVNFDCLKKEGYLYDASMNPTYLPGRYNNLSQPIRPYHNGDIHILPSSVTPILRIPLFWLSFKNLPNSVNRFLFKRIQQNGVFVFYIHPWEFADIDKYQLPNYVKRPNSDALVQKLDDFLSFIAPLGHFSTCKDFLKNKV
jgi:peptidoglycan/xylan/chitin deacetylase (PgdA/CDA1 family)